MVKNVPQIRISVLPFRDVGAFADIESRQIFLAESSLPSLTESLCHELAHIVSADPDHGCDFRDQLDLFGGTQPPSDDLFKRLRRRLGIPTRMAANVGNITGVQNMLLDYHLLQAYRKFSQKVLSTEGHWEVINEVERQGLGGGGPGSSGGQAGTDLSAGQQLLRLYPTPKGVYPVVVLYYPIVTHFRSPQARKLANDMLLAETKCMLGYARRKIANMPGPTGGNLGMDGESLVTEGNEMKKELTKTAIEMGEPLPIIML